MKSLLVGLALIAIVFGHGRSTQPVPRDVAAGRRVDEQNAPVSGPNAGDFVCRNIGKGGNTATLRAGQSTTFAWSFSAAHVGDCAAYLSYDGEQSWFKIWEMFDCRSANNAQVQVNLPSWLPSCPSCVLRWEWYALHQWPNVEFYSQCADVQIVGNGGNSLPATFRIPGHLPASNNQAPGYRNPFGGSNDRRITGPAIASGPGGNVVPPQQTTNTPPPPNTPPPNTGGDNGGNCFANPALAKNLNGPITSTCGANAPGNRCANGMCCSQYGYCGSTGEYCNAQMSGDWRTAACQVPSGKCYKNGPGLNLGGPIQSNSACGQNAPGSRCPNENCCSQYGYCGTTNAHCQNNQGDWRTVGCSGGNNVAVRDNIFNNVTNPVDLGEVGFSSASKVAAAGLLAVAFAAL